jgi:L-lactate dehydrogenase
VRSFSVDPIDVEAQVSGDHGTSAGVPITRRLRQHNEELTDVRPKIEKEVRYANITIIEGRDASQYGIGIVSARIAEMILRDEQSAIPIGSYQRELGVAAHLPRRATSSMSSLRFAFV